MSQPVRPTPRIVLNGIRKVYPSVVANDGIDLEVMPGEIHAVVGENGAGKSTLMKIIYGVTRPDAGEILWEGKPLRIHNPAQARELGIGMVFQHFSLFETLTVTQNVALSMPGPFDLEGLAKRIEEVSERYGLPVDPNRLVHDLSVGERQRVEITRCLLQSPRLLILDEPTSVLTPQAVRKLFETLRQLAAEGCSILYISHKLDEIQELCHKATVLRAGRVTGTCVPSQETPKTIARMMIGEDLPVFQHGEPTGDGEVRLRLEHLSLVPEDPFGVVLRNVNLEVHSGEIVGIAGVSGNGQQELMWAISGEEPIREGSAVQVCGVPAGRMDSGRRRSLGLCFVPEERLGRGAVPRLSLAENALLTAYRKGMLVLGLIRFGSARRFAEECIKRFDVKCGGPTSEAKSLSGGQPAEVHRGPGDHAEPQAADSGAAHLGCGRGCRFLHPAAVAGVAGIWNRHPGGVRGTGRTVRDLRPSGGHRQGQPVSLQGYLRDRCGGDWRLDERHVAREWNWRNWRGA